MQKYKQGSIQLWFDFAPISQSLHHAYLSGIFLKNNYIGHIQKILAFVSVLSEAEEKFSSHRVWDGK